MGKSDTFRKGTEKGRVVVIKSRSDSHSQTNRLGLTQRELPDNWDFLVRITHIMLKKRFYLTATSEYVILTMSIRIEDS